MPIYTRSGDTGYTSLIGGTRVPKHHVRVEALGTVDELMAFVSLLRDAAGMEPLANPLRRVLDRLMACASMLAVETADERIGIPQLSVEDVLALEQAIDALEAAHPNPLGFVLPGGHPSVSLCHVARTVCRRAERRVAQLMAHEPVPELPLQYLNRLSDYLFALSSQVANLSDTQQDIWNPGA